ncbi:MAG: repeat containing protein [Cyanobacteria bacterium RYN_339]|nr:repeat containing protein [Cyanobacteria bacterium RYN_339]
MARLHRLPLALTLAVTFAAGCGPVKIDVGGVLVNASPRPGKSPGDLSSAAPDGSPTPMASATAGANATPTPRPNGTVQPNQTPTPDGSNPQASPTATPVGATPTPTPGAPTPTPIAVGNASIKSFSLAGPDKPMGVGVDSQGNAWVGLGQFSSSSTDPGTLVKLGPDGTNLKAVVLPGQASCVVVDKSDNVWVLHNAKAQFGGGQAGAISKVSAAGEILSTQVLGGALSQPATLVLDPSGNLWTTEQQGKIDKVSPNGGLLGSYSTGVGGQPFAIGVDAAGIAWVGSGGNDKNLLRFSAAGTIADSFKLTTSNGVYAVAVDSTGSVWAGGPTPASSGFNYSTTIAVLDPTGKQTQTFEVGAVVRSLQPGANKQMWALTSTQAGGGSVTKLGSKGESLDSFPAGDAPQNFGMGGDGSIWVTNPMAGKVTRILPPKP